MPDWEHTDGAFYATLDDAAYGVGEGITLPTFKLPQFVIHAGRRKPCKLGGENSDVWSSPLSYRFLGVVLAILVKDRDGFVFPETGDVREIRR